jgi:hypothetical protein
MNGRFYMILILGKNISQYMQGSALHKHRTFYIAISPYGWRTIKDSLHPFYFEGNKSAEFLRDLVCSCKGKSQCKKSCVCAEQNLACTDLCSLYKAFWVTGTAFFMWKLECSTQDLSETRPLQNNETARQKVYMIMLLNALYSCFALFLADLYSVDAFCCIQEVVFLFISMFCMS